MATSASLNAVIPGTRTVTGVFEVGMHDGVTVAPAFDTPATNNIVAPHNVMINKRLMR
jgi:hypothetical protein